MVSPALTEEVAARARRIRLVLSDVDGTLTDGSVYVSATGESLKRFSLRDGMGVERLRVHAGIETALVTRETSRFATARAEKLGITAHTGILDKASFVAELAERRGLERAEIAFLGDDVNDLEAMSMVGLAACPADAFFLVREGAHVVCPSTGGNGAFRDLAEILLAARLGTTPRA